MKLSFTTLGCPGWDWETILTQASSMGFDGIELRGIGGEMRLAKLDIFSPGRLQKTASEMADRGLAFSCLDTSCNFHDTDKLAESFAEARETIDLAYELGCPYIRVFGDRILPGETPEQAASRVGQELARMGEMTRGSHVRVLLETHGHFSSGARCKNIMEAAASDRVGLLWDTHHPYKFAGESMEETWSLIGPWVYHTHLKDSRGPWDTHKLCNMGKGDLPLDTLLRVLREGGYTGWYSYEHEKRWHPELAEPEEAFPEFISFMRSHS